jgi:hypothetical protein
MTEQELRARVCRQAEQWLGCRESDGSHRPIIDLYNRIRPLPRDYKMTYDDPWCAAFVSAVGAACDLTDTILPECGCEPMIALYQAAGRWEEADDAAPRPGDLIFYDWEDSGVGDCVGAADHVGLVTENEDDLLTVIEGNLSDAVGRRRIYAGARFIRGYARPDYLSAALASPSDPVGAGAPDGPSSDLTALASPSDPVGAGAPDGPSSAVSVGEGLAPPADAGTNPTVGPSPVGAGAPDGPSPDLTALASPSISVGEGLAPPADAGTNPTVGPTPVGAGVLDGPQSLPLEGKVPPQGADEVSPSPSSPASPVIANQSGPASPERGGVAGACAGDGGVWCGNPHPSSPASALTPLPLLRRGDRGAAVQSAQLLLIARGYRCGPWGADGDFGAATLGAVYRFQQGRRLAMDGEIGPLTWAKLVGEKE